MSRHDENLDRTERCTGISIRTSHRLDVKIEDESCVVVLRPHGCFRQARLEEVGLDGERLAVHGCQTEQSNCEAAENGKS